MLFNQLNIGDKVYIIEVIGTFKKTTEYKEKNIPTDQLIDSFHKSFYQAAIRYIISKEPTLELFNGKIFNDSPGITVSCHSCWLSVCPGTDEGRGNAVSSHKVTEYQKHYSTKSTIY